MRSSAAMWDIVQRRRRKGIYPVRGGSRDSAWRAMRPRAAIAQAGFALSAVTMYPLTHALGIRSTLVRHRAHRLSSLHRLNHPQSTHGRHGGILVSVHSVLLAR